LGKPHINKIAALPEGGHELPRTAHPVEGYCWKPSGAEANFSDVTEVDVDRDDQCGQLSGRKLENERPLIQETMFF
jgi:hypothetical protein